MKKSILKSVLVCAFLLASAFVTASDSSSSVPKGYGGVQLGMSLDEAKKALMSNSDFGYNGDRDVSLLPGDDRILIETDASKMGRRSFLSRCWFQFYEENLYAITINMNPAYMDHYSLYSTLVKKYGEPVEFSPERSVWEGNGVRMSLERPLSVKYLDLDTADKLVQQSTVEKTASEYTREMFLDSF